jgi:predicted GNAT family N-acyltransferase
MKDLLSLNISIYLHSQADAGNFYERHGFEISGDAFDEAGIRHFHVEHVSQ